MRAPELHPSPVELVRAADGPVSGARIYGDDTYTRVRPGVYARTARWSLLAPWERYLARVHAFALIRPDAVFAFESAAALRGLPLFGEPRDVHIFDAGRRRSLRYGDVAVHTSGDERDADAVGGMRVTTPADTVVDLVRVLPPAFALAVADAALHRGFVDEMRDLVDLAASQRSTRGRRRLQWVWPRVDGRSESVGESVARAVIEWTGFPAPELQTAFRAEGHVDRVDFFWPRWRIIGESDGYGKYAADTAEKAVAGVIAEKEREDRLRRQVDGLARWDWKDTMRGVPQRDKLLAEGLPLEGPPQQAMLATLRHHPRSLPPQHPRRATPRNADRTETR